MPPAKGPAQPAEGICQVDVGGAFPIGTVRWRRCGRTSPPRSRPWPPCILSARRRARQFRFHRPRQ
eukprot:2527229-Lingulodinium_polyedra.AAC.1